jgi:hypothetical protein
MTGFSEIEKYLNEVEPILIDLKISLENAKYLGTLKNEDEIWASKHSFFGHYSSQMKFVCAIQLCKLLDNNENQKLNFFKFLRRIKTDFKIDKSRKENYSSRAEEFFYENLIMIKEKMPEITSGISEKINCNEKLIRKLKDARDKVYAHSDPSAKDKFISWTEISDLSNLAIDVYNKLNGLFRSTELYLERLDPWSPRWVIERLAKTRKYK